MTTLHDPPSEPPTAGPPPPRRPLRLAVAAGAVAVALVVGVVVVTATGDDPSSEAVQTSREPAPEAATAGEEQTAADDGGVEIDLEQLDDTGAIGIRVDDPAAPSVEGAMVQACVLVSYRMSLDAADERGRQLQAFGCAFPGTTAELRLDPTSPATVGCAAVVDPQSVLPTGTVPVEAVFTVTPTDALQVGPFEVTVQAATGYGDGCEPPDDRGSEHLSVRSLDVMVG